MFINHFISITNSMAKENPTGGQMIRENPDRVIPKTRKSILSLVDLVLTPSSFFRHIDWARMREIPHSSLWPNYLKASIGELARLYLYYGAIKYYYPNHVDSIRQIYEKFI